MKLLFRQRFFSWFDSYDIFDEAGNTVYTVEGKLAWGHCLHILDASGTHIATLREEPLTLFFPTFHMFLGEEEIGTVTKEFTLFRPSFTVDYNGWTVEGDFFEWDYEITADERVVASVSKELFRLTDTYEIDVRDAADALGALMVVLAIDAEKCSRSK